MLALARKNQRCLQVGRRSNARLKTKILEICKLDQGQHQKPHAGQGASTSIEDYAHSVGPITFLGPRWRSLRRF